MPDRRSIDPVIHFHSNLKIAAVGFAPGGVELGIENGQLGVFGIVGGGIVYAVGAVAVDEAPGQGGGG